MWRQQMSNDKIVITNVPAISAIYFALLQCGYEFYSIERSAKHISAIESFYSPNTSDPFFLQTKQHTCAVYPYWPRAAILETASFYIDSSKMGFADLEAFQQRVMSAGNLSDAERDQLLWSWIVDFPKALERILHSRHFMQYKEWEDQWIQKQNMAYRDELLLLQDRLDLCKEVYRSPVKNLQIVLSPIKCIYASDYHMIGDTFLFSSGAFEPASVTHELLHPVVHPMVQKVKEKILENKRKYRGIDDSYYLSGHDDGQINAFEEFLVRSLTKTFEAGIPPTDLDAYTNEILQSTI